MPEIRKLSLALALAAGLAAGASAQTRLHRIRWQFAPRPERAFNDIQSLARGGAGLGGKLRARVALENPEDKPEEGILLRYTVSAKLGEAWAVPFLLEEKRVPRIPAQRFQEAVIDPTVRVDLHLRKLATLGQRPEALRLQVMVEPRRGESFPLQLLESVLPLQ